MAFTQPTQNRIREITDDHIMRFERMIESGSPNVNVGECRHYLAIWRSVKDKDHKWENLSTEERQEIQDAVESGEY